MSVQQRTAGASAPSEAGADPLWYKDAVIYELHVRAFSDSDADGIGDFSGLTERLDYLQDLGVTAIWMLPFYPSPLRDDGYDIADYAGVNPSYGTMRDVKRFIAEAHRRGIRVITELVINHTSDQHEWFQRARRAPKGSRHRDFYVWSDAPDRYSEARIIFKDFETSNWAWDPVANAYYWHRFYSHQPDLNFENPAVFAAVTSVMEQWLELGVDGMRLDAIPYLFEREGTNCENLPETHEMLRRLRAHVDQRYPGRMLLAEANQWPEDAIAYFGTGDECHMAFHFPVMPRLFMAIRMEDRFPIVDILKQTPPIPEVCQWAMFLRNHDELTLEMVTDEERDYMYRVYAHDRQARINLGIRRRLAPLLGNNRRKIELMNGLLFALPGTPVLYYGDEIGMGDNIYLGDRDSVRTPMQWSGDRNAGFSRANPQRLFLPVIIDPEYHYEAVNVESQQANPSSLLWWTKRLIALRKRYPVFGRGSLEMLHPSNPKVLAFVRQDTDSMVLVVANLSRFVQCADLDLSAYEGRMPVELFGHTEFPEITDRPYFLTLGPHSFYWFELRAPRTADLGGARRRLAHIEAPAGTRWLEGARARDGLAHALLGDLPHRRWFAGKSRTLRGLRVSDVVKIDDASGASVGDLVLVETQFVESEAETYAVSLGLADAAASARMIEEGSPAAVATVGEGGARVVFDAMSSPAFCRALLDAATRRRRLRGAEGEVTATPTRGGRKLLNGAAALDVHVSRAEQSNTSAIFGEKLILKLYRRLEAGVNPDLEIARHLTERVGFAHTPALVGAVEYSRSGSEPLTLALIQEFVPNQGDAWRFTLDQLGHFYEAALSTPGAAAPAPHEPALALASRPVPDLMSELLGQYLESVELLGKRTAEMHTALATDSGDPAFTPERFTTLYRRSMFEAMRSGAERTFQLLRSRREKLPDEARGLADTVLTREEDIVDRLRGLTARNLSGLRIRCHGDYHLGQVLWTGKDFVIIDFEGEPSRSLGERRLKRTALRDVAGMLRSFDYAASTGLRLQAERGTAPAEAIPAWEPWARAWRSWVSAAFLRAYLETARASEPAYLPDDNEDIRVLLEAWLIDKAMYEIRYELGSRPDWAWLPLRGVLRLLDSGA